MIYVFKTSVLTEKDIEVLKPNLEAFASTQWNFDLEDCDKILRVDAPKELSTAVIELLLEKGYDCEELSD